MDEQQLHWKDYQQLVREELAKPTPDARLIDKMLEAFAYHSIMSDREARNKPAGA